MRKHWKMVIIVIICAALCLGYYYYLANKPAEKDATDQAVQNEELAYLTTRNISDNYPKSVRDVVKLYARITKEYYEPDITDEDIEKLGHQARLLFDDELKGTQTDDEFMQALKDDINVYRSNDARINSFSIQSASDTKYTTFNNRDYASLQLAYYIREGSNLHTSGTKFTLRKDNSGKWKILYWELVDSVDLG